MHPSDRPAPTGERRLSRDPQHEELKAKECAHAEQHHALLPLPLPLPPSSSLLTATSYERRRPESHERASPPLSSFSTVFPANPFGQERRQHYQFPHHDHHPQHQVFTSRFQPYAVQSYSPVQRFPRPLEPQHHIDSTTPPRRTSTTTGKGSLAFILGGQDDDTEEKMHEVDTEESLALMHLDDSSARDDYDEGDSSDYSLERYVTRPPTGTDQLSPPPQSRASVASGRKGAVKKSRICKVDGCTRYVVNKGLCIGHGGGKRCAVAGCTSSAKNMGVCWKHGGSTKCTIEGCDNRAKSRGVCWSHGGGRKCKEDSCVKTAVSNGLCWAHGGGKRCIVDGCKKPAYERNGNLCALHKATHAPSA